jgi:hypothetical protein
LGWLIPAAKRNGRNSWTFVITTLFLGPFGPSMEIVTDKAK